MGKKFKKLFSNFCCSYCRNDIDRSAFVIVRKDKGMNVVKMVCPNCGKDFGIGFLKIHEGVGQPHAPLEFVEGMQPVSTDEVLDIHKYLRSSGDGDFISKFHHNL